MSRVKTLFCITFPFSVGYIDTSILFQSYQWKTVVESSMKALQVFCSDTAALFQLLAKSKEAYSRVTIYIEFKRTIYV